MDVVCLCTTLRGLSCCSKHYYMNVHKAIKIIIIIVSCPAPLLEEEGDIRGFSWADWNAISAEWHGFYHVMEE